MTAPILTPEQIVLVIPRARNTYLFQDHTDLASVQDLIDSHEALRAERDEANERAETYRVALAEGQDEKSPDGC